MFFRKKELFKINKDEQIESKLLLNAYKSVDQQVKISPLENYLYTRKSFAMARLNLYAMNTGILDYFIDRCDHDKSQFFISNLHRNLIEIICSADIEVIENIEDLILDKNYIDKLLERSIEQNRIVKISKKDLLKNYLSNRIKQYYYAVDLRLKFLRNQNSKNEKIIIRSCPITKLFSNDSIYEKSILDNQFIIQFSHNIAIKGIQIFSKEVDEMFS